MRRALFILFAVVLCFPLSGCWSKLEINDRAFITAAYIDLADTQDEVELTISTPLPNRLGTMGISQGSGDKARPYAAVTKSAQTLTEALQSIQDDLTRQLTWGQTRVLVISREYAEHRMDELLEWAARLPFFPLRTYIFISPGKAKDVVKLTPVYEQAPSEVLREFSNRRLVASTTLRDIVIASTSKMGTIAPLLNLHKTPLVSEGGRSSTWAEMAGSAMFQGNAVVGDLGLEETRAISWARNNLAMMTVAIKTGDGLYNLRFDKMRSRMSVSRRGNSLVYHIRLNAQAGLGTVPKEADISNPSVMHQLENKLNKQAESNLKDAIRKSQQVGADILELGSLAEWRYPGLWKKLNSHWAKTYTEDLVLDIQAHIQIIHLNAEYRSFNNVPGVGSR